MTGWELPRKTVIAGTTYGLHTDYREILEIFTWLQNESYPEFLRWQIALAMFFEEEIPADHFTEAAAYFQWFVNGGRRENGNPGPRLLDWEQDAQEIVADVNKVAGKEIRDLPYLHWWTCFLALAREICLRWYPFGINCVGDKNWKNGSGTIASGINPG